MAVAIDDARGNVQPVSIDCLCLRGKLSAGTADLLNLTVGYEQRSIGQSPLLTASPKGGVADEHGFWGSEGVAIVQRSSRHTLLLQIAHLLLFSLVLLPLGFSVLSRFITARGL